MSQIRRRCQRGDKMVSAGAEQRRCRQIVKRWFSTACPRSAVCQVGNILWKRVMRSELTVQKAQVILHALESLPLTLRPASLLAESAMTIACGLKRSFYDSLYMALAVMTDCRLVTADGKLFDAVNNAPQIKKHLLWIEDVPGKGW